MYFRNNLFVQVSRAKVRPEQKAEYLTFRKNEILPQMGAWPGFVFSQLLRRVGTDDEYLLINAWQTKSDVETWRATDAEAKLREKAKTILAQPLESLGEYEEIHL